MPCLVVATAARSLDGLSQHDLVLGRVRRITGLAATASNRGPVGLVPTFNLFPAGQLVLLFFFLKELSFPLSIFAADFFGVVNCVVDPI